jgi:hypothetical protein
LQRAPLGFPLKCQYPNSDCQSNLNGAVKMLISADCRQRLSEQYHPGIENVL